MLRDVGRSHSVWRASLFTSIVKRYETNSLRWNSTPTEMANFLWAPETYDFRELVRRKRHEISPENRRTISAWPQIKWQQTLSCLNAMSQWRSIKYAELNTRTLLASHVAAPVTLGRISIPSWTLFSIKLYAFRGSCGNKNAPLRQKIDNIAPTELSENFERKLQAHSSNVETHVE